MSNLHHIPNLDKSGLRRFGITTALIVAVLFGLFFPWLLERPSPYWPWIIAGVLLAWGLVAPVSLRPVYRGWMLFGLLLNRVTTPLILTIVYFAVILPMGWIRRLFGAAGMPRNFDKGATTYRIASKSSPIENLERPF